jgi:hypothetical protein
MSVHRPPIVQYSIVLRVHMRYRNRYMHMAYGGVRVRAVPCIMHVASRMHMAGVCSVLYASVASLCRWAFLWGLWALGSGTHYSLLTASGLWVLGFLGVLVVVAGAVPMVELSSRTVFTRLQKDRQAESRDVPPFRSNENNLRGA